MESKPFTLRVRSSEGTFRIQALPEDTVASVATKVAAQLKVPGDSVKLSLDGKNIFSSNEKLFSRNLKNGDLLLAQSSVNIPREASTNALAEASAHLAQLGLPKVEEDEVDQLLDKEDGWIKQQRNEKTCFRHPPNGSCVHCMPVPPWGVKDIEPWKTENLKHIPFTSWLRKRDQGRGECRHTKAPGIYCQNCRPLTEEFYTVQKCDLHEPWPKGVCSKCKPDTIRLVRQEYRHVDHCVFENTRVLETLISAWRETGCQRGGFLFGRYVPHKDVPLGIKVLVEAIYEPPQINSPQGLQLKDNTTAEEKRVEELAKLLGLVPVGFAWTSIEVEKGKIIKSRDLDKTYLASGPEMLQSALFQNEHPSPCRHSLTGKYGSKWISVLITGTAEGEIAPVVFQVSDQMAGMARDGIVTTAPDPRVLQTVDNPLVYVPKVLYDDTNEYGRAVVKEANPTFSPIPYWVDINFAAPKNPNPLLPTSHFPSANRAWAPRRESSLTEQLKLPRPLPELFADFAFFIYLGEILDTATIQNVATGILKKDGAVLKSVVAHLKPFIHDDKPVNPPVKTATGAKTGAGSVAPVKSGGKHPKEAEWIGVLKGMGFEEGQIRTALEKSKWQGVEQALGFLL